MFALFAIRGRALPVAQQQYMSLVNMVHCKRLSISKKTFAFLQPTTPLARAALELNCVVSFFLSPRVKHDDVLFQPLHNHICSD